MIDKQVVYDRMPRLATSVHNWTSNPTDSYNCVGWIRTDLTHWWSPWGFHWPDHLPSPEDGRDLHCFVALFREMGYEECISPEYEEGFLKIAIYAQNDTFHHVALQLRSGLWSSKVGEAHDLSHELHALDDSLFFEHVGPTMFMRRHDNGDLMPLQETGLLLPGQ